MICEAPQGILILIFILDGQVVMDPNLTARRKTLIADAGRALDKAKMLRFDEKNGNLYVTDLGRVASHYYIKYTSIETYNEMLKRHMNDSEVGWRFIFQSLLL